jgi:hypothetical protein
MSSSQVGSDSIRIQIALMKEIGKNKMNSAQEIRVMEGVKLIVIVSMQKVRGHRFVSISILVRKAIMTAMCNQQNRWS